MSADQYSASDRHITRRDLLSTGVAVGAAVFGAGVQHAHADVEPSLKDAPLPDAINPVIEPSTLPPPVASPAKAADFQVPYNGKQIPLSRFLGKATLVINPKLDDPISMEQMPGITNLVSKYSREGLRVLMFPTDQGYFEADEDRVVKIKFYQFWGFGQYPLAVVFDKIDIVGNTGHPFFKFICRTLKNPNGIGRITLDYEKFLLDAEGNPLRRYPRRLPAAAMEEDIKAALAGRPLPAESREYKTAWVKAQAEAERSEYAFKLNMNYYNNS